MSNQSTSEANTNQRVKVKATIGAVKFHGPNSPAVLAGEAQVGDVDTSANIEFGEPVQYVEITYEDAVTMFGEEKAEELFNG